MKHFINGFVNLSDEKGMERVESQLLAYMVRELEPSAFIDFENEDSRYWVIFTDELLKKLDLSEHPNLACHVKDLLDSDFSQYGRCYECGQVTYNFHGITYRGTYCVGRSHECLFCQGLDDASLAPVSEAYHQFGTGAAVKYLLEHHKQAPAFSVVAQFDPTDSESLKTADGQFLSLLLEKKANEMTMLSEDGRIFGFESSTMADLLAETNLSKPLASYLRHQLFEGFKSNDRCVTCGSVIYHHQQPMTYSKGWDGLLTAEPHCAVCAQLSECESDIVYNQIYSKKTLMEALKAIPESAKAYEQHVVLPNFTPVEVSYGEIGFVIGNDLNLPEGTIFNASKHNLSYHVTTEATTIAEAKEKVEAGLVANYHIPAHHVSAFEEYLEPSKEALEAEAAEATRRFTLLKEGSKEALSDAELPF